MTLTNKKAIEILNALAWIQGGPDREETITAISMAIEALTDKPTGEWVEIENGEYLCSNCSHITIGYPPSNCPNCGSFNRGKKE